MKYIKRLVKAFIAVLVLSILGIGSLSGSSEDSATPTVLNDYQEGPFLTSSFFETDISIPEEEPKKIEPPKPVFPNDEQTKLMGRLAEGIYKWKTLRYTIPVYFCGEAFSDKDGEDVALTIAYHIVRASWEVSDGEFTMNPWGVAGTMQIESGFDLCAFGLYPRRAAYKTMMKNGKPVLKPRRRTISHTREEVISAIKNPKMLNMFETFDLGALQTLAKYYPGEPEDLLTWEGFYWQVDHMKGRGKWNKTGRPWEFWPGGYSPEYDKKVTKNARRLGATKEEI